MEDLAVEVTGSSVRGLRLDTPSGWSRRTSVVTLTGPDGSVGEGEDVTYGGDDHDGLQGGAVDLAPLHGEWRLGELWSRIAAGVWFEAEPGEAKAHKYRRCALSTAALELACDQNGTTLELLAASEGLASAPELRFCVSLALDGREFGRIDAVLERVPDMCFKIDFADGWDALTLERLKTYETTAGPPRFGVVDFKGFYRGTFQGPAPRAELYARTAEALPRALLEDPWLGYDGWEGAALASEAVDLSANTPLVHALEGHEQRVTFDAPFASRDWLAKLPVLPRSVNLKPSRFGGVRETLEVLALVADEGLGAYVGGQFELGPARTWLQRLARIACPDGPNDCAPTVYNEGVLPDALPASPLTS